MSNEQEMREAFEDTYRSRLILDRRESGEYVFTRAITAWDAWQARAALSTEAQGEKPKCSWCRGIGKVGEPPIPCTFCHGTGKCFYIKRPANSEAQGEPVCDLCKGSGEYTHLVGGGPDAYDELGPCPSCDGTGDAHRADGEYLGKCDCNHQPADTEAQPEVTGAVAWLFRDESLGGAWTNWQATNDKGLIESRMSQVDIYKFEATPLYPPSAIEAAVNAKLEEAARIVENSALPDAYSEGCLPCIAEEIRALMESPQPSVEEPAN